MKPDEKERFVERALRQMAWHTFPCIASVIGGTGHPRVVASGLRLWASRPCLVTAAHIARTAPTLTASIDRAWSPVTLSKPSLLDEAHDVAVYWLTSPHHERSESFWPIERVDERDCDLSSDLLVVHGFPLTTEVQSQVRESFAVQSFPYGSMSVEPDASHWLAPHQFAIPFDPSTFASASQLPLRPDGMSGSAVWRVGANGVRPDEWSSLRSSLVGIVTGWDETRSALVATRASRIVDLLRG